jgi:hypothetical protein
MTSRVELLQLELESAEADLVQAEAEARCKRLRLEHARSQSHAAPLSEHSTAAPHALLALAAQAQGATVSMHQPASLRSTPSSTPMPPPPRPSSAASSLVRKRLKVQLRPLAPPSPGPPPSSPSAPSSSTSATTTSETTESAPEISDEGDSDSSVSEAQPRHVEEQLLPRKRKRQHRSTKLSSLHSMQKADIQQRRRWLRQARGDKTALVTHRLQIPAYYHPDLDEHRHLDAVPVQSASEPCARVVISR